MKTNKLFISLISSALLIACTTDDSVLEQERVTLEATEQQARIPDETIYNNPFNCDYEDLFYVYYSNSSVSYQTIFGTFTSANLSRISLLREDFIANEIDNPIINGCPKYNIPKYPKYLYSTKSNQYYEIWEANPTSSGCKGGSCGGRGDEDDVEL